MDEKVYVNKITNFFKDYGLSINIEPSSNRPEYRYLKRTVKDERLDRNNQEDREKLINYFLYYFGGLYIKDWKKLIINSNISDEELLRKFSTVVESIYIRDAAKEFKLSFFLSALKYNKNNLIEIFRDKELLKYLSMDLLIKSYFQSDDQMEQNISKKIYQLLNDSLENSGFNKRFKEEFPEILFDFLETVEKNDI